MTPPEGDRGSEMPESALVPKSPDELEEIARTVLSGPAYDWIAGGAGFESSVAANAAALERMRLVPRVLRDVSTVSTSCSLLGSTLSAPILVAPIGAQTLIAPQGELLTAAATARAGLLFTISTASGIGLEEVAEAAPGARWFQLYWQADRRVTADLVARAAAAGYSAIVLTVDSAAHGVRWRDVRNAFRFPPDLRLANMERYQRSEAAYDAAERRSKSVVDSGELAMTWRSLEWLRAESALPLVLKGILSPEDARIAEATGVDGIWVSNHGGRQLDRLPGTLDVLPSVVDAVTGRVPVIVDGGFRSAADIALALALGAKAVGIGRTAMWALASEGEAGVHTYLEGLVTDLQRTLRLLGMTSLIELDRSAICHLDGRPFGRPIESTASA